MVIDFDGRALSRTDTNYPNRRHGRGAEAPAGRFLELMLVLRTS